MTADSDEEEAVALRNRLRAMAAAAKSDAARDLYTRWVRELDETILIGRPSDPPHKAPP